MGRLCVKRCPGPNKLHIFPNRYTDKHRRKKWCQLLGVKDMPHELYACSRHFSRSMLCLKHPRKDAVPDMNLAPRTQSETQSETQPGTRCESITLEIEICDSSTQTDPSYFNQTHEQFNHSSNYETLEELYADEHEIETTIAIPIIQEIKSDPLKDDNFKPRKINMRKKPALRKK